MYSDQAGQPFLRTQSLWRLIEYRINEYERFEVKAILGESIVDQTLELHEEVDALLKIWEEYRDYTLKENAAIRLPEPPEVRQRLGQEINFFVTTLRERAVTNGLDPQTALERHTTKVIEYAANVTVSDCSPPRPKPAAVCDGRQTPCVESNCDRLTQADIVSEDLTDMSDKLNLYTFDNVVEHFRSVLQNEVTQLGEDIALLQKCLEDEADFRSESCLAFAREPTLAELKAERTSLEHDVMMSHVSIPTPPNIGPKSTAVPSQRTSLNPSLSQQRFLRSAMSLHNTATRTGMAKYTTDSKLAQKTLLNTYNNSTTFKDAGKLIKSDGKGDNIESDKSRCIGTKTIKTNKYSTKRDVVYADANKVINGGKSSVGEAAKITLVSIGGGSSTVHVASIGCQALVGDATVIVPAPPTVCQPRPSSAARFRRMVHNCRDDR